MLLQFDDQNRMCTRLALKEAEKYTCSGCGLIMGKQEVRRHDMRCKMCGMGSVTQSFAHATFYKQWYVTCGPQQVNFDCDEWRTAVKHAQDYDLKTYGCFWSPGEL